jgi:DNA-binding NarL/FixJ family response regulator
VGQLDLISAVEAAYELSATPQDWLDRLLAVAGPSLQIGGGITAYVYDTRRPLTHWLEEVSVYGLPAELAAIQRSFFTQADQTIISQIHALAGPISALPRLSRMSRFLQGPHEAALREVGAQFGFEDIVGINATEGSGRGLFINLFQPRKRELPPTLNGRLSRLAAHLSSAMRLRSKREKLLDAAVLSAEGRLLHAQGDGVAAARARLSKAAKRIDQARSAKGRANADASLSAWSALVEGRWSLVERLERDGKRLLIVYENAPELVDPRALSATERAVTRLVALGQSNKLVAYELGLPEGTVARALHTTMKKLGVASRVELIREVRELERSRPIEVEGASGLMVLKPCLAVDAGALGQLTKAEREIALLLAEGMSNAEIARARAASARTVTHQLSGIFHKLQVTSRAQLVLRLVQ